MKSRRTCWRTRACSVRESVPTENSDSVSRDLLAFVTAARLVRRDTSFFLLFFFPKFVQYTFRIADTIIVQRNCIRKIYTGKKKKKKNDFTKSAPVKVRLLLCTRIRTLDVLIYIAFFNIA